jgi:hypothetical protein
VQVDDIFPGVDDNSADYPIGAGDAGGVVGSNSTIPDCPPQDPCCKDNCPSDRPFCCVDFVELPPLPGTPASDNNHSFGDTGIVLTPDGNSGGAGFVVLAFSLSALSLDDACYT